MSNTSNPRVLFKELERNFHSIEQFNELVRASAFYYQKHGHLNMLKIFIPSKTKDNEGHVYLHDWDKPTCEQAVKDVVGFFTRHSITDSYTTEVQDDGIYVAMTTNTHYFLTMTRYLSNSSYILDQGKKNGIIITAEEWLRDFPFEFHAAWWNRKHFIETIVAYLRDENHRLFQKAIYDGRKNWREDMKFPKIEKWNPTTEFIPVYKWKWKATLEKEQQFLKEFKERFK